MGFGKFEKSTIIDRGAAHLVPTNPVLYAPVPVSQVSTISSRAVQRPKQKRQATGCPLNRTTVACPFAIAGYFCRSGLPVTRRKASPALRPSSFVASTTPSTADSPLSRIRPSAAACVAFFAPFARLCPAFLKWFSSFTVDHLWPYYARICSRHAHSVQSA